MSCAYLFSFDVFIADLENEAPPSAKAVVEAVAGGVAEGHHPHVTSLLPLWAEMLRRDLSEPYKSGEFQIRNKWGKGCCIQLYTKHGVKVETNNLTVSTRD